MDELYLGLISGTSVDGIDAALVRFEPATHVIAAHTTPWPDALRRRILALAEDTAAISLDALGELDARIGDAFGAAANDLLRINGVAPDAVRAIGSHGQTVCHRPQATPPFTLQLGDPARIAEATGIDVVADFRRADVAAGGQGAPLVPAFHRALFGRTDTTRVILNLGGIANVTLLAADGAVTGFDTGPANGLLDAWANCHLDAPFDAGGEWAAQGHVDDALLARLLADPYFALPSPKSTGREVFNLDWLRHHGVDGLGAADVQATLVALTARSVAGAVRDSAPDAKEVLVAGGGVHNPVLMAALQAALQPMRVFGTAAVDVDPDFIEATAFAWLARQRLLGLPGNLPVVTGARGSRVLGVVAKAPRR